jgi:hypothetical protein
MRVRWLGVGLVAVLVVCTLLLKSRMRHNATSATVNGAPAVILVADLSEANDPNDRCADIIRAVREVSKRGIKVAELPPDSNSDLLRRYRVLTVPTVLLLDRSGNEIGRFEGEDSTTVKAVQTRLTALVESKP